MDLIKVAVAIGLLFLLIRLRLDLGLSMVAAGAALGLLFQMGPGEILRLAFQSSLDASALNLILVLLLIMFLRQVMDMPRLASALKGLVRDSRAAAALGPAIIGLLPSAGGAYFSAPVVEEVSEDTGLDAEKKSFINYWY